MNLAQLRASRSLWRSREVYRRRKYDFYRTQSKRPAAERVKLRQKWFHLYAEAKSERQARDRQIAKLENPYRISDRGLNLIAEFEGYRRYPYRDAVGVPTIGYGETRKDLIAKYAKKGISQPAAYSLLRTRVNEFGKGVKNLLKREPTRNEFSALTSFAYNVGLGALAGSSLLREFNAGRKNAAADEFLKWDKAGGQRLAGLTRRRKAERALFKS